MSWAILVDIESNVGDFISRRLHSAPHPSLPALPKSSQLMPEKVMFSLPGRDSELEIENWITKLIADMYDIPGWHRMMLSVASVERRQHEKLIVLTNHSEEWNARFGELEGLRNHRWTGPAWTSTDHLGETKETWNIRGLSVPPFDKILKSTSFEEFMTEEHMHTLIELGEANIIPLGQYLIENLKMGRLL